MALKIANSSPATMAATQWREDRLRGRPREPRDVHAALHAQVHFVGYRPAEGLDRGDLPVEHRLAPDFREQKPEGRRGADRNQHDEHAQTVRTRRDVASGENNIPKTRAGRLSAAGAAPAPGALVVVWVMAHRGDLGE